MAVYTALDYHDIAEFIAPYRLGTLTHFQGITAGIENTNYMITIERSQETEPADAHSLQSYILTLFESSIPNHALPYVLELCDTLDNNDLPVPTPLRDNDGRALRILAGKPALLVPKLEGSHPDQPTLEQCQAIGTALAKVHTIATAPTLQRPIDRGIEWMHSVARRLAGQMSAEQLYWANTLNLLEKRISQYAGDLPQGVIHGDLFRDNALFIGNTLSGLIDFYNAGRSYLLLDLAIVVNDWAVLPDSSLDHYRQHSIVDAYHKIRPLTPSEHICWNDFLCLGAARFWLSRLTAQLENQRNDEKTLATPKDPSEYMSILQHRTNYPVTRL